MYTSDIDIPEEDMKRQVLSERNNQMISSRQWLSEISQSSRRRHEFLLEKQRKERLRRRRAIKRIEYQRLRNMVPSIATKPSVDKVTVIEEAIRYIDHLHLALLHRLKTKGLPRCLQDVDVDVNQLKLEDIKTLVCQLVEKKNQQKTQQSRNSQVPSSQVSFYEKSQYLPVHWNVKRPKRT